MLKYFWYVQQRHRDRVTQYLEVVVIIFSIPYIFKIYIFLLNLFSL